MPNITHGRSQPQTKSPANPAVCALTNTNRKTRNSHRTDRKKPSKQKGHDTIPGSGPAYSPPKASAMRNLPLKARIYLLAVYLCGMEAAICAFVFKSPPANAAWWELPLFAALALLAGGKKVQLMRHKGSEDVGSMSLGFAITFMALLRLGPGAGMLIAGLGTLSACVYPRTQPAYQAAFNVSLAALEAWLSGMVFLILNGFSLRITPSSSLPAVSAATLTYYGINTGGVAMAIGFSTGRKPYEIWKNSFLWTAPSYFMGASVATLGLILFGHNIGVALLFGSPIAYFTYQSYAVYTARAEEKQQHIEELQLNQAKLADLYLATIKSLALAIDAKDQYTHQHILRVQRYAIATAQYLGLSGPELQAVNTGALLHDIGKLGVPEYVLLKPGRLTEEEFAKIKKHPEIGAAILDPVEFPWPVVPVVKHHHEKWDGTGYPDGLKGEEIPITARILAVADVYDALTSTRSYRSAWSHEKALEVIRQGAGSHFDPRVVEAFLAIITPVVEEMANEGFGPLAAKQVQTSSTSPPSKSDEAVRDIQRASSELWALYEVAQTLSASIGLKETLDILAGKLSSIMPGTACVFMLKDASSGRLVARTAVGVNGAFFRDCATVNSSSRSAVVANSRKTYWGPYDPDDLILTSAEGEQWVPLNSALIVPIVHEAEVLGTINLYHPAPRAFGPHDRQLLETIADRAAMAIFNGLLFDRTRSHALTDPLTGLLNLRYLHQYVNDRCSRNTLPLPAAQRLLPPGEDAQASASPGSTPASYCGRFALLCLDLDSFKPINDNFGHQRGDEVLKQLSVLFRSLIRDGDVVVRYGGDEFVIVLQDAGEKEAVSMAWRVQEAVAAFDPGLIHPRLGPIRLGVSIGYACYPDDGDDCASLLAVADTRMYKQKTERKLGVLAHQTQSIRTISSPDAERRAA